MWSTAVMARTLRGALALLCGKENGVTFGLLGGYCVVAFVMTFPLLSFTEWMTYVLDMEPNTQSYYWAVGMMPWGLKPIFAYLLQYVPAIAGRRRVWVAAAMGVTGLCYALNALLVRSIPLAFITCLCYNIALAFVELALGSWLVDCAHRDMRNAGAVQAAATAARSAGSFFSCLVQLIVYPCHDPAPYIPPPPNTTFTPAPHVEELSLVGSWDKVMLLTGVVTVLGVGFTWCLPAPAQDEGVRAMPEASQATHKLRTQQNLWLIAALVAFQAVTVWATLSIQGVSRTAWWVVLFLVVCFFFVVLCVAYRKVSAIMLRLKAYEDDEDKAPPADTPSLPLLTGSAAEADPKKGASEGSSSPCRSMVTIRDGDEAPPSPASCPSPPAGPAVEPVFRLSDYYGPLAIAVYLFALNATPTAGVQYSVFKYRLFRKCDLVHFSAVEYAAGVLGCVFYTPLANRQRIGWVIPVFTWLSVVISLLQIPIARLNPDENDGCVDIGGWCVDLMMYNYIVTVVSAVVGKFAFIPLQVLATEQTPKPHRLLAYAIFLSFLDCGASAREWVTAPLVTALGLHNSPFDYSNLYILMIISGASSVLLSSPAPWILRFAGQNRPHAEDDSASEGDRDRVPLLGRAAAGAGDDTDSGSDAGSPADV